MAALSLLALVSLNLLLCRSPIGFLKQASLQGSLTLAYPNHHLCQKAVSRPCIEPRSGPPTIRELVSFVLRVRFIMSRPKRHARYSQFEAGTPNVAVVGDFSSPPCRLAKVASFARFSTARRVSFTIVAHPITRPATPTRPDDSAKRAITMNAACRAEPVRMAPKSEISAAAAKEPMDV